MMIATMTDDHTSTPEPTIVRIGIVGAEGKKFTRETERLARDRIAAIINAANAMTPLAIEVVSGECHLGGIDAWAREEAQRIGVGFKPFPPATQNWAGFKARNIQIAEYSDRVYCLVVRTLPPGFIEGGWERYCYHCGTSAHIKSGGCWTVKRARSLGKRGEIVVIGGPVAG